MAFPSLKQVGDALLVFIYENGGEQHAVGAAATYVPLADRVGLSPAERTVSRRELYGDNRSEPAWHSSVQYARRALLKAGLLSTDAKVGVWMLSSEGVSAAERLIAQRDARSHRSSSSSSSGGSGTGSGG